MSGALAGLIAIMIAVIVMITIMVSVPITLILTIAITTGGPTMTGRDEVAGSWEMDEDLCGCLIVQHGDVNHARIEEIRILYASGFASRERFCGLLPGEIARIEVLIGPKRTQIVENANLASTLIQWSCFALMVGERGFGPPTPWSRKRDSGVVLNVFNLVE